MKSTKDILLSTAEYFGQGFLIAWAIAGAFTGFATFAYILAAVCSYASKAGWNLF